MSDNQILLQGDSLEVLKDFPSNSIDAVVTDPPYGLSFMGKKWDYDVPSKELWVEVLRVLKPGGHLLSFGGTRTYHRMVVAIEDAGFEIRDQVQWLYGSGFPKSYNLEDKHKGWGTALKPANEPICLARKPLEKGLTIAQNVEKWSTGAINIDASRIGTDKISTHGGGDKMSGMKGNGNSGIGEYREHTGRWPANIILDEQAAIMLDTQQTEVSRFFYVAKSSKRERNAGLEGMPKVTARSGMGGEMPTDDDGKERDRFSVTQANHHPTVKPIKLMEYLCRMITPPGGVILDPFMGSGTTGIAAKNLNFEFIGIELSAEYLEIAQKRIGNT